MQILKDERYFSDLAEILDFIAKDSLQNALRFEEEVDTYLGTLVNFPYKYRKSIYFDDDNIRDAIFKGYVIPYVIELDKDSVTVLGIVKWKRSTF